MDGLNGESLIYADNILSLLLSLCFTCMFKHSFIPSSMLNSVIIPLVKNKCGDLSDKNNYRPIALSSIISKVLERIILSRLEHYIWTNPINLDSNLIVFALMSLLNISKVVPLQCLLIFYMQAKYLIK